jgi:splicing factor 1
MSLNPATRQSSLFKRKRTKKIRIPIEEHPNYNFIGLIIGPRGKTQKELEAKTGCKIAIRGKGSVKEGARGRRDGKMMEGDDEPLHVVITGDDQKSVDAAADMIEQMLVVIDDEKNVHKQQQLRELALLNGTLKEDEYCQICAEKGHRSFECPRRFALSKQQNLAVKCAICGDTSHPTRDCTQKPTLDSKNQQELDSDYMSFMAELDGKKNPAAPSAAPISGVTILKPAVPVSAASSDSTAPATGITILKPATKICMPVNTNDASGMPPAVSDATLSHTGADLSIPASSSVLPPPPPMSNLPPVLPPPGLPPLPTATLPPPPGMASSYAPPTSQPGNYYGNSGYGKYHPPNNNAAQGYGQQNQQHYQSNQGYNYNTNAQQPNQQQQQQQQQGQPPQQQAQPGGDPATGWDYQAYYGGASGGTGGAGGFNWWDQ